MNFSRFQLRSAMSAAAAALAVGSIGSRWPVLAEPSQAHCESSESPAPARAKLKLVQVVVRHGARTPLTLKYWDGAEWDKDSLCGQQFSAVQLALTALGGGPRPSSSHDKRQMDTILPGGCSKGELTWHGQAQSRNLGKWLRERYVEDFGLIPSQFQAEKVYARSTNYQRTVATIQGVLTGLYPSTQQPIPVETAQDVDEILFANAGSCERLRQLLSQARERVKATDKEQGLVQLTQRVSKAMHLTGSEPIDFVDLYDALSCLRFHGKPLPGQMTPELLKEVEHVALRRMAAMVSPGQVLPDSTELVSLGMGQLFALITQRMQAVAAPADSSPDSSHDSSSMGGKLPGSASHKMLLYAGHDTTIMPILTSLGYDMQDWPPYLSNVIFELWERDGQHLVRVLYNLEPMTLPASTPGELISLEEFVKTTLGRFLMEGGNREDACRITYDHQQAAPRPKQAGGGDSFQGL